MVILEEEMAWQERRASRTRIPGRRERRRALTAWERDYRAALRSRTEKLINILCKPFCASPRNCVPRGTFRLT